MTPGEPARGDAEPSNSSGPGKYPAEATTTTAAKQVDATSVPLTVPEIAPDADKLTAALGYAAAGWYVVPVLRGTKDPGSVVGKCWQQQSSRDPRRIAAWFAGTDHDIALHCGRSGAVAFDVDHPHKVPEVLAPHLEAAPSQSTRPDSPGRNHYVFLQPPGRTLGNSTGKLGGEWGQVRGLNGVIIAQPSSHADGGEYHWVRTGPVPVLPDEIAELLGDASPAEDAATDEQVRAFLAEHVQAERPDILHGWRNALQSKFKIGSRHDGAVSVTVGAMKEARAGFFSAQAAVDVLQHMFVQAATRPPVGDEKQRTVRGAAAEYAGILAWAVAQALAADLSEVRARTEAKMPGDEVVEGQIEGRSDVPPDGGPRPPYVALTRLSDVKPERVSWLWPGRIPVGKLVTLDGDPGLGKSTLAVAVAAPVTTGGTWPDGTVCAYPGAVLLMSAEDGLADTVRPRLDAAGADVTRVHAIDGVTLLYKQGERVLRPPTLADILALEEAITSTSARLLVIDVVMAYLPDGTDSHKDQDIRRVLSRLSALADRTGCSILLIRHLNKAKGSDPLYRGGGSIGIVGAARAGMLVAADPDDDQLRVLASVKSNLGPTPESLTYRLVESGNHGVARVQWEGPSTRTARTLLAEPAADVHDVEDWLRAFLAAGPRLATEVYAAADPVGFSKDKAKRAKKALGVHALRYGKPGKWYWSIDPFPDWTRVATDNDQGSTDADNTPDIPPLRPCSLAGQKDSQPPRDSQGSKGVSPGPPGGITSATPGFTDRVLRALTNAMSAQEEESA